MTRLYPREWDRAKAVQFGLVYGITPAGLAGTLGIPPADAGRLIDDYFRHFPRAREFILLAHDRLERDGFGRDVFGRRRYSPEVRRGDGPRPPWDWMTGADRAAIRAAEKARREAQNFLIHGPCATVTKLAMRNRHRHVRAEHPDVRLVLTLHDELHFEAPEPLVPHFAGELPALMCDLGLDRFGIVVPMTVAVRVGPSWGPMSDRAGRDG